MGRTIELCLSNDEQRHKQRMWNHDKYVHNFLDAIESLRNTLVIFPRIAPIFCIDEHQARSYETLQSKRQTDGSRVPI